jgi:hypothetical protein
MRNRRGVQAEHFCDLPHRKLSPCQPRDDFQAVGVHHGFEEGEQFVSLRIFAQWLPSSYFDMYQSN